MFDQDDLNDSYIEDVMRTVKIASFIVKLVFIIALISIFFI